jgi:hypothetical protein
VPLILGGVLVVGVVFGLTYFFVSGRKPHKAANMKYVQPRETEAGPDPARPAPHLFWGRQLIVPEPGHACRHARELNGSYFSNGKAPHLPLPDCDSPRCTCWFKVAGDNRSKEERRLDLDRRIRPRANAGGERRAGRERRAAGDQWKA